MVTEHHGKRNKYETQTRAKRIWVANFYLKHGTYGAIGRKSKRLLYETLLRPPFFSTLLYYCHDSKCTYYCTYVSASIDWDFS